MLAGVVTSQLVALLIMIIGGTSSWLNFLIIGVSLCINLLVFYLRLYHTQLASYLFVQNLNTLILLYMLFNLFPLVVFGNPDFNHATLFTYILSLPILLAGMVINTQAAWRLTILNSIFIFVTYFIFFNKTDLAIRHSIIPTTFLYLIAIVSWLYQSTLNRAQKQLIRAKILEHDMEIARDLQQQLYPPSPHIGKNITVACRCEPARETGGDFYDFVEIAPNHEWGILLADVTGKSLAAALLMTMARSILRDQARRHPSPAKVLVRANQVLFRDAMVKQMVTAFYAILNLRWSPR